jgi:hypothetical protein
MLGLTLRQISTHWLRSPRPLGKEFGLHWLVVLVSSPMDTLTTYEHHPIA